MGWAKESGGSKQYDDEESVNNLTSEDEGIVDLYAVWYGDDGYVLAEDGTPIIDETGRNLIREDSNSGG